LDEQDFWEAFAEVGSAHPQSGWRRLQESIRKETGTEEAKDLHQRLPPKSSSNEPLKIQSFK
jgi:hypothetical protein